MMARTWRTSSLVLALLALAAIVVGASPCRADDEDCLACHGVGEDMVDLEDSHRVDADAWAASIHADMGFGCTDCHVGIEDFPHEEDLEPAACATCHEGSQEEFEGSVHAKLMGAEFSEGSPCGSCHGVHDVRAVADPESRVYFRNIPSTCESCHGDSKVIEEHELDGGLVQRYEHSVHGASVANGAEADEHAAVCTDCHGSHDIRLANDPESTINPFKLPEMCGECHPTQSEEYLSSVHGVAFQKGRMSSPTCTDCHGIHDIKLVDEDAKTPAERRLVRTTCPACHSSEALMSEYGVTPARVTSYQASYHGLANARGNAAVADCASCHGIHAIYPSSDPRSTVAPANLQETCGDCHPGASTEFTRSPVHYITDGAAAQTLEVKVTEWVKRIYWILIIAVLGGMVVHNIVIMSWYVRRNWRRDKAARMKRRFDTSQVMQHGMLVLSFVVLVISGFMLAYPDTWWSRLLVDMGVTESIRRWTHRVAAIVMVLASILHIFWILGTPYGRAELRRIAPGARDVREVIQNMKFHLGKSKHPAAFAKYDYPAKAEYWALVWGTVVMAVTGLILWFPVVATSFLPGWSVKVAEVIHLFEAWLATLAIVIFHFFYVIAHPEVYPISFSMMHGGMREEVASHHHPAWTDDGGPSAAQQEASRG